MQQLKLLTIDDEPGLRRSIRSYFEDSGYEVLEAENGTKGLAVFRTEKPDVVLVDLRMPEIDGMEVTRILHKESPDTPLIIVSGTGLIENAIEAIRQGAWDYVTKPVLDMKALQHCVARNLERASLIRENKAYQAGLEQLVDLRTAELKAAVDELTAINRRLKGAVATTLELQGFDTLEAFGRFLMNRFRDHMAASGGSLYLCEKEGLRLVYAIDPGHAPDFIPYPLEKGSVFHEVLTSGKSLQVDMADKRCDFQTSGWNGYRNGSCLIFPLSDKSGENAGVMTLHNKTNTPFIDQDHEIGSILANFSSEAIRAIRFGNDIRQKEQIFKLLAKSVTGVSENDILNSIVKACSDIFQADVAMIGSFMEKGRLECHTLTSNGRQETATCERLQGSPCEIVMRDGYLIIPKGLGRQFSQGCFSPGMDAYVGVSLKDKDGHVLGVLSAQNRTPMTLPGFTLEILDILAVKGSAALERRKERKTRQELLENLQQAQKMEAIGTLAGGIAHDFNNILSPIMGYAELLQLSISDDDELRENVHGIIDAAYRARDLVQQILTISRKKGQKKKPLSIHPLLKEAMKMIRATLPTTIAIRERINTTSAPVLADPTQIHQMIMNLCTNAFHAMESRGGILEVSLDSHHLPCSNPFAAPEGDYVKLTVKDTGKGIPPDIMERIFDPYFTTKAEGKGTGLGLAVLHGIVASHGGYVSVDSVVDQGTTFRIFLPALDKTDSHYKEAAEMGKLAEGEGSILLVDDQADVLEVMSAMLTRLGYRTTAMSDSRKALELFRETPDAFDLVITDQTMPDLPGIQLAEQLVQMRPDIPVVLCSGYDDSLLSLEPTLEKGIVAFEPKPVDMHRLAAVTARLLDRRKSTS